ncbi:MAG: DUF4922 domain-containing protein [Duncaniella sp.]|nr:DUF4922 domain-containing protein [Duncaniella sp.]
MNLISLIEGWAEEWPLLRDNRAYFENARKETIAESGEGKRYAKILLKYRKASLTADLGAIEKGERACFLCDPARPKEQKHLKFKDYKILANPYPASGLHFTVVNDEHIPQSLNGRVGDMLELADRYRDMCVFYNGPRCGASAPDHQHFQMILSDDVNIKSQAALAGDQVPVSKDGNMGTVSKCSAVRRNGCYIMINETGPFGFITVKGTDSKEISEAVDDIMARLDKSNKGSEPMVNVLAFHNDGLNICIIPRRAHRPSCYGSEDGNMLVSPASIEMAGTFILSREEDFKRLGAEEIRQIYAEVAYTVDELKELLR